MRCCRWVLIYKRITDLAYLSSLDVGCVMFLLKVWLLLVVHGKVSALKNCKSSRKSLSFNLLAKYMGLSVVYMLRSQRHGTHSSPEYLTLIGQYEPAPLTQLALVTGSSMFVIWSKWSGCKSVCGAVRGHVRLTDNLKWLTWQTWPK